MGIGNLVAKPLAVAARDIIARAQARLDALDARCVEGTLDRDEYERQVLVIVMNLKEALERPVNDAIWQVQHASAS
ncbi:hypothetical protein [Sulfobacillus harzensis]|uniref:Uncharacterized protein n=1 Tax=Sulfobacillus harzensis TaxID=2729629 RepID=A0A7Y0L777_9FIRM|nr:hypothetical protein [Sulfobacillus harzensis]NMP24501.1 hypothetical protein [Sulfobacillus harzensis]